MHPPFLQGSLPDISFPPVLNVVEAIAELTGFSDAVRVAVINDNGVFSKLGRSVLVVGSGDRCLDWPESKYLLYFSS